MFTPDPPHSTAPHGDTSAPARPESPADSPSGQYPFRLLPDEVVVGTFPLARAERPLGKLASFLFVTDSRLVYSAEAKTISSSSTHSKEFRIDKVDGIEVGRHTGFDSLGVVALVGSSLNFLTLFILGVVLANSSSGYSSYGWSMGSFFSGFQFLLIPLAIASLVLGVMVAFLFRKPRTVIKVLGPDKTHTLAQELDLPRLLVLLMLFLVFGIFIGIAIVLWWIVRELGIFNATDAEGFAPPANVDHISYEAGMLILDVQARGTLAGQR